MTSHRCLRRTRGWIRAFLLSTVVAACGTSEGPTSTPDGNADWAEPGILLGDWVATKIEHRSQADPLTVVELPDTFTLSVDGAGRYEARLTISGAEELGWVRVELPSVTFRPTNPPGSDDPGTLQLLADTVLLVGDSELDFGGGVEPSVLTLPLIPR